MYPLLNEWSWDEERVEIEGDGTEENTTFDVVEHMEWWEEVWDMVFKKGIVKDVDKVCEVGLEPFIGRDEYGNVFS